MNTTFLYIIVGIVAVAIISLIVYVLYLFYKEKEEPTNPEIVVNLMNSYSGGHGLCLVNEKETSEDRIKYDLLPRDINYLKVKDTELLKSHKVFPLKDFCIPLGNSTHREISLILPPNPEYLPESLKKHPFGKVIMKYIEDRKSELELSEIYKRRISNQNEILKKTEGLEIVQDYIEKSQEINKDVLNSINTDTEKKKKGD